VTNATHQDSLQVLREYRNLAPWNLRDWRAGRSRTRRVGRHADQRRARAQPSQRTVRFTSRAGW